MRLGLVTRLNPTIKDEYEFDGCENRNNEDVDDIRDEIKILQHGLMLERLEFISVFLLCTESLFITSKYDNQRLKLKLNRTIEWRIEMRCDGGLEETTVFIDVLGVKIRRKRERATGTFEKRPS